MTTPLNSYSTGTVAVSADGTTVTGTSTIWSSAGNVKPGDLFQSGHYVVPITDVTDDTHFVITPWPGSTLSGATYVVWKVSQQRIVGETYARDVDKMVGALNTSGFFVFVGTTETVPDPSLGDDGQYAYQPSTGAYWLKTGGVWVASGSPAAGYGGTSTTSVAIGTGSKIFTTQSGLAYNGARVRAAAASDATKWMEGVATYSGTTLTITVDKTGGSGTFASWTLAIAGQPANGDLSSANNLSDVANAATARVNLGIRQGVGLASGQDFNTVVDAGTYYTVDSTSTNTPTASANWYLAIEVNGVNPTNYIKQTAVLLDGSATVYVRNKRAGVWDAWNKLLDASSIATKSDQQTATSLVAAVTPGRQQYHDSAAKAWVVFHWTGSAIVIDSQYNVASVTRGAAGVYNVNFTTPFASGVYVCQVTAEVVGSGSEGILPIVSAGSKATSSVQIRFVNTPPTATVDPTVAHAVFYGRQ